MKQRQSIGSHNQQQGLPDNRNQQTKPAPETQASAKSSATTGQADKPAVTDDAGNPVNKTTEEAGKGYAEKKQTEPYSNVKPNDDETENRHPAQQATSSEKAYGANTDPRHHENLRDHNLPEQNIQEVKEAYEKRIRQSGNVAG